MGGACSTYSGYRNMDGDLGTNNKGRGLDLSVLG